jgi:hypothetical protein
MSIGDEYLQAPCILLATDLLDRSVDIRELVLAESNIDSRRALSID